MSHLVTKDELRRLRYGVAALSGGGAANSAAKFAGNAPREGDTPAVVDDAVAVPLTWRTAMQLVRRESPSWLVSAVVHLVLLVVLGIIAVGADDAAKLIGLEMSTGEELSTVEAGGGGDSLASAQAFASEAAGVEQATTVDNASTLPLELAQSELAGKSESMLSELKGLAGDDREIDGVPDRGDGQGGGEGSGNGAGRGAGTGNGYAMFYGHEAKGNRFVYVVDSSMSMTGLRFKKATDELMSSIVALDSDQQFYVVFFNTMAYPQFYPDIDNFLTSANAGGVDKLAKWLRNVSPFGRTDPSSAIAHALRLEPDAIFLLSDGEFDLDLVMYQINKYRQSKVPIHTVALGSDEGAPMLIEIAKQTGGEYRWAPTFD